MLSEKIWRSAVEADAIFRSLGCPYCIIGGIAIQRWGEPRVTRDVDFSVFTGFGNEAKWISRLLELFTPRINNAADFAKVSRVLLVSDHHMTPLDIALGGFHFEKNVINRASDWGTPQRGIIFTCSAEDLVVMKAFADRPQDWIDIERVVVRQGSRLNRALVLQELEPLTVLKEEPEIIDRLEKIFTDKA